MGAAGFGGSFDPIVQYEKWGIHPVFPHFPYFRLGQKLSPNLLAPLCGVALNPGLALLEQDRDILSGIRTPNASGNLQQLLRGDILRRKMEYHMALRVRPGDVRTGRESENSVNLRPLPNNVSA